jgi:hypothetical protein
VKEFDEQVDSRGSDRDQATWERLDIVAPCLCDSLPKAGIT